MLNFFRTTEMQIFGNRAESVPLKKLPWNATVLVPGNSRVRVVTSREATALLITAKAIGEQRLIGGMRVPRRFELSGHQWVIENGCGQDIVRSGTAGWIPADDPLNDEFVLTNTFIEEFLQPTFFGRAQAFLSAERSCELVG